MRRDIFLLVIVCLIVSFLGCGKKGKKTVSPTPSPTTSKIISPTPTLSPPLPSPTPTPYDALKADTLFMKSLKVASDGDYEKAIEILNKGMKYSKEAIMYVKRGEYYLNMGKFKEAEKDFNTALDKHPPAWDKFTAYSYYILITNKREDFEKTKQFLKKK